MTTEGLSFQPMSRLDRAYDDMREFRNVYSESVIAARKDLTAEYTAIAAEIEAARAALSLVSPATPKGE